MTGYVLSKASADWLREQRDQGASAPAPATRPPRTGAALVRYTGDTVSAGTRPGEVVWIDPATGTITAGPGVRVRAPDGVMHARLNGYAPSGEAEYVVDHGGGGITAVVPLALIVTTLPTDCDELDATVRQCFGPYYFARLVTYDPTCGAWADGGCVYLLSEGGQGLVLNEPYPARLLGDPPAEVAGASVPVDFPCEYPEGTQLYGTHSRVGRMVEVLGEELGVCEDEEADGFMYVYPARSGVWRDCEAWTTVEDAAFLISRCPLTPGRYPGTFERMAGGDEFGESDPRECTPVYSTRREKNQAIDMRCEGGNLNQYGPDPLDPCGDELVFIKTVACCDPTGCSGGGGGGSGGTATCCGRTLNATLRVTVYGEGVFNITWNAGTSRWEGSAALPCGESLYVRQGTDCIVEYSCDGVSYAPAAAAIGSPVCTPTYTSVRWTINMDNTSSPPNCITGKCGNPLDLVVQE